MLGPNGACVFEEEKHVLMDAKLSLNSQMMYVGGYWEPSETEPTKSPNCFSYQNRVCIDLLRVIK